MIRSTGANRESGKMKKIYQDTRHNRLPKIFALVLAIVVSANISDGSEVGGNGSKTIWEYRDEMMKPHPGVKAIHLCALKGDMISIRKMARKISGEFHYYEGDSLSNSPLTYHEFEFDTSRQGFIQARDGYGWTVLHYAAFIDNQEMVNELSFLTRLNDGLHGMSLDDLYDSPNLDRQEELQSLKRNASPLHLAAMEGHMEIVKLLNPRRITREKTKKEPSPPSPYDWLQDETIYDNDVGIDSIAVDVQDDEGLTPLHYAAAFGQVKVIEHLIGNMADPNGMVDNEFANRFVDSAKRPDTPLLYAARRGHVSTMKKLISDGADPNAKSTIDKESALLISCRQKNSNAVHLLLTSGADMKSVDRHGRNCLHFSAESGMLEQVKELVEKKVYDSNCCDGSGNTPLMYASAGGCTEVVDYLLSRNGDVSQVNIFKQQPLHLAAKSASLSTVKNLLAAGADPNAKDNYGWRPVHYAASGKCVSVLISLHESGGEMSTPSMSGLTPLHISVMHQCEPAVTYLIGAGANINSKTVNSLNYKLSSRYINESIYRNDLAGNIYEDDTYDNYIGVLMSGKHNGIVQLLSGSTPFHIASVLNSKELSNCLFSNFANCNITDDQGFTPLMTAVMCRSSDVVMDLIIKSKVKVNTVSNDGLTALDYAHQSEYFSLVKALKDKGGLFACDL